MPLLGPGSIHRPRVRVQLGASTVTVLDGRREVARHERATHRGAQNLLLDHYLEILQRKPGALPGATALARARATGAFTSAHEAFWAAARKALELPVMQRCEVDVHRLEPGLRPLIDVLVRYDYDQAIVLGYRDCMKSDQADARSMLTLLALERAFADHPKPPRIVAEMRDRANVTIAATTGADDFIVSDELSSLIAQLSERLELEAVFHELFDADRCTLSLRPATAYAPARPTTYASIVAAAAERGESALGYRSGPCKVVLNPRKSTILELGEGDQVLVITRRIGTAEPAASA